MFGRKNAETSTPRTDRDDIADLTRIQANLINARNLIEELPESPNLREIKATVSQALERTTGWPTGRYNTEEDD